jgi:cell division control protein 6
MSNEDSERVIADSNVLREEYIPPRVEGRETQINQLLLCLTPAIKRKKPLHCWLHGKAGVGKTTVTRLTLRNLEREFGIRGVYINCFEHNTFYAVIEKIVVELKILGADKLNASFKLERLERFIQDRPFIIVLDEFDRACPKERDFILYNLSNLRNTGLIVICHGECIFFSLDDRVKSRLQPIRIDFASYSVEDLVVILRQRALSALFPGTWGEKVLAKIAEASDGDARIAIQTLKNVAYCAEGENKTQIRQEDLKKGRSFSKDLKKLFFLDKLTEHHKLLYNIIKKRKEVLSGKLWSLYLKECEKKKMKPMAVRTYSLYTNKLIELGLIKGERALVRGKVRLLKVA